MNYWEGAMNWPLDDSWRCEICGSVSLIWGIINGVCRCDVCHTEYTMRDGEKKRVTRPIWLIKSGYASAAKWGWKTHKKPVSQFSDDEWDSALAQTKRTEK